MIDLNDQLADQGLEIARLQDALVTTVQERDDLSKQCEARANWMRKQETEIARLKARCDDLLSVLMRIAEHGDEFSRDAANTALASTDRCQTVTD